MHDVCWFRLLIKLNTRITIQCELKAENLNEFFNNL